MKNAKQIGGIGQVLLVLGSALYLVELLWQAAPSFTLPICCIYAVALVLLFIGWIGTRDERRAAKAAEKAKKEAA